MSSTLPLLTTPPNALLTGLNSTNLASAATKPHPLQTHLNTYHADGSTLNFDNVQRIYGSGMAMRLRTEREMASVVGGRIGLNSQKGSLAMLGSLSGTDNEVGFEDFLNQGATRPEAPRVRIHDVMEVKMGL